MELCLIPENSRLEWNLLGSYRDEYDEEVFEYRCEDYPISVLKIFKPDGTLNLSWLQHDAFAHPFETLEDLNDAIRRLQDTPPS